jgi:hypothetical protein
MWAAKAQTAAPISTGGALARMITKEISACQSMQDLEDVISNSSSSFDYIHTTAALVQYARLSRGRSNQALLKRMASLWLQVMPDAGTRACSNALWSFGSIGLTDKRVWDESWQEFVKRVQVNVATAGGQPVPAQEISSVLWACGKLQKRPSADDLQLLLQAFLRPAVLDAAAPQALSNVLLALGYIEASPQPVLSLDVAQQYAKQVLPAAIQGARATWQHQDIGNALWALGELRIPSTDAQVSQFLDELSAAPQWCLASTCICVGQVQYAFVQLAYRNEGLMQKLLRRSSQLLQPDPQSSRRRLSPADADSMAAMCIWSVSKLDMPQLVPAAVEVVKSSGIGRRPETHPANLSKLWEAHAWLLQHGVCNGKGLQGVVNQQQLLLGQKRAAERGART